MKVDVINMNGEKVKTADLPAAIFEAPIKTELMHQAFVRQMANARLGTHKTKTRSEVSGGGKALAGRDELVEKSVRNLPKAKTLRANYLNVRDLLQYDRVIMPLGALDVIQSYLGA
ncbi:MAG: 50S ribosomal protein L4 [Anaerolineales bacterium]